MSDCLFCQIIAGEIPADKVLENEAAVAFRDIDPQAPTHVLVVPKFHVETINDLGLAPAGTMDALYDAALQVARQEGIAESGYRAVINCNDDGGQLVPHVHLHVLGGRRMQWPPG